MAKFFVAIAYNDFADAVDKRDVLIGKRYRVYHDTHIDMMFFIDEAGDKNYGCDNPDDSVYEFKILTEDEGI